MKIIINEIPNKTESKVRVTGATYKLDKFCDARQIIEEFMSEHNISHASFTITGAMREEIYYKTEEKPDDKKRMPNL